VALQHDMIFKVSLHR